MWGTILGLTLLVAGLLAYFDVHLAPLSLLVPLAYYAYASYAENARRRKIDEEMPRALLELSSLSIRTYDDLLKALSRGYGILSEEVRNIMDAKMPGERKVRALESLGGEATRKAIDAIITGMRSGANMRELLREVAEDLEARMDVERSKSASLSLQRYSTMLTAGVFVPVVLGLTARLTNSLISTELFPSNPGATAVLSLLPIHVAVVAAEAALYLATMDGKMKNAAIYAALLIPLAVGIFMALGRG